MTVSEFEILCGEKLINLALAIESEKIMEACENKEYEKIADLLDSEF